jgi:hypothetical protein
MKSVQARRRLLLRKTFPILCLLVAAALLLGETTATTPSTQKKKESTPAAASKAAPGKSTSKKTTTAKRGAARKPAVRSWRTTQRAPTADRYKEIQQALASKGYMESSAPSGVWDDSSISALKRFQQDQNLEPSGRIDSLSLIALGLGPKREQAAPPSQP